MPIANAARDELYSHKVLSLSTAESTLHCIEASSRTLGGRGCGCERRAACSALHPQRREDRVGDGVAPPRSPLPLAAFGPRPQPASTLCCIGHRPTRQSCGVEGLVIARRRQHPPTTPDLAMCPPAACVSQILGCIFSTVSALAHGEARLALWSLSALLTSALSLYLLHRRRDIYLRPPVRDCLYAAMRLHRAFAIVGMRRWGCGGAGGWGGQRSGEAGGQARGLGGPRWRRSKAGSHTCLCGLTVWFQQEQACGTGCPPRRSSTSPHPPCRPLPPLPPTCCRVLKAPMMMGAAASSVGDRVYFAKAVLVRRRHAPRRLLLLLLDPPPPPPPRCQPDGAVLPRLPRPTPAAACRRPAQVNSSILPILLQALVLQLPLPLQAAVQVGGRVGAAGGRAAPLLAPDARSPPPLACQPAALPGPRSSPSSPPSPALPHCLPACPPARPLPAPAAPGGGGRRHPAGHARLLRQPGGRRPAALALCLAGEGAVAAVRRRHGSHLGQVGGVC